MQERCGISVKFPIVYYKGVKTSNDNSAKDPEAIFVENVTLALRTSFNFIEEAFHQVEVR